MKKFILPACIALMLTCAACGAEATEPVSVSEPIHIISQADIEPVIESTPKPEPTSTPGPVHEVGVLDTQTIIPEEDTIHIVLYEGHVAVDDPKREEDGYHIELSESERDLLLRLIMCEAGGEDVETIAHVIAVVYNRVLSDLFPDDVSGVIYQSGQFSPVSYGLIYNVIPNESCVEALALIESGWNESNGALYFETHTDAETWHRSNLEFVATVGNLDFYK